MTRTIKLLHPYAKIPIKKHPYDAGYDCYLIQDLVLPPYSSTKFPLGFAIQIKPSQMLTIRSRSSTKSLGISCTQTTCDAGYTGQLFGFLINHTSEIVRFSIGERVVQLVFISLASPEPIIPGQLDWSDRNSSGFGSSGRF